MIHKEIYRTFKHGSRTYFYSSLFFPRRVREDVFTLYAFVRQADNYVDTIPQQKKEFYAFIRSYREAQNGLHVDNAIIEKFVDLINKRDFDNAWIDAFLDSMEMDLTVSRYQTMKDILNYIYGSAEVIGFMMARILGLPPESYSTAGMLGRAMQYINFIRDIGEDLSFNRFYFPLDELHKHNLYSLDESTAQCNKDEFKRFIRKQIDYYWTWQMQAEKGFIYIPTRYLIPIKTASELYKWTAHQIKHNPFVVYHMKIKPRVSRIIGTILYTTVLDKRLRPIASR